MVALVAEPVAPIRESAAAPAAVRARPIPVYALGGSPRWVTYEGRRQRVVAVQEQPAPLPLMRGLPRDARRVQVRLASGSSLTLLHGRHGWQTTAAG